MKVTKPAATRMMAIMLMMRRSPRPAAMPLVPKRTESVPTERAVLVFIRASVGVNPGSWALIVV